MGREEQIEEREVLNSIFPEEIQNISETEYRISIHLDTFNNNETKSDPPTVLLQVKYPPGYPDEPPVLDLLSPPNAPVYPLFSLTSDKHNLLEELAEIVQENLGIAMIFTLVSALKDSAEQLIASRQEEARHVHEQQLLEIEREENKKFYGMLVTPRTFASWREGFRMEMQEIRSREEEIEEATERKKTRGKDTVVALTGKQLWERDLVGKTEEEEYEDREELDRKMNTLKVGA